MKSRGLGDVYKRQHINATLVSPVIYTYLINLSRLDPLISSLDHGIIVKFPPVRLSTLFIHSSSLLALACRVLLVEPVLYMDEFIIHHLL